jgi:hypothetical protein
LILLIFTDPEDENGGEVDLNWSVSLPGEIQGSRIKGYKIVISGTLYALV